MFFPTVKTGESSAFESFAYRLMVMTCLLAMMPRLLMDGMVWNPVPTALSGDGVRRLHLFPRMRDLWFLTSLDGGGAGRYRRRSKGRVKS
jgi:hypothetical protein